MLPRKADGTQTGHFVQKEPPRSTLNIILKQESHRIFCNCNCPKVISASNVGLMSQVVSERSNWTAHRVVSPKVNKELSLCAGIVVESRSQLGPKRSRPSDVSTTKLGDNVVVSIKSEEKETSSFNVYLISLLLISFGLTSATCYLLVTKRRRWLRRIVTNSTNGSEPVHLFHFPSTWSEVVIQFAEFSKRNGKWWIDVNDSMFRRTMRRVRLQVMT